MTLEKLGTWIAIIGALVGVGISWADLNNKIDNGVERVNRRLDDFEKRTGDAQCLQILNRRIVSIEKRLPDIEAKLRSMSDEFSCTENAAVSTGTRHSPSIDWELGNSAENVSTVGSNASPSVQRLDRPFQDRIGEIDSEIIDALKKKQGSAATQTH